MKERLSINDKSHVIGLKEFFESEFITFETYTDTVSSKGAVRISILYDEKDCDIFREVLKAAEIEAEYVYNHELIIHETDSLRISALINDSGSTVLALMKNYPATSVLLIRPLFKEKWGIRLAGEKCKDIADRIMQIREECFHEPAESH